MLETTGKEHIACRPSTCQDYGNRSVSDDSMRTVVSKHAHGLRAVPRWEGVGGEARVDERHIGCEVRRLQVQIVHGYLSMRRTQRLTTCSMNGRIQQPRTKRLQKHA
jgi:hypothetical protein